MARNQYPLWSISKEGCLIVQNGPTDLTLVAEEEEVQRFLQANYDAEDWPSMICLTPNMQRFGLEAADLEFTDDPDLDCNPFWAAGLMEDVG